MAAAGLASATAALVTSRFGVAGTLIGAALTTMIITGGSAILRSYLERVTGRVRKVPGKVREKAGSLRNPKATEPQNIPERPDLRNNFMGRLRAAFDWFFRLPPLRRRAILVSAVVPAVIAFLISMGAVTGLELAIGNSLPCGVWNKCPVASDGSKATNAYTRPTILGGGAKTGASSQDQQSPGSFQKTPGEQNAQPADPNAQPAEPQQPATPDSGTPDSGTPDAGTPNSAPPDSGTPNSAPPNSAPPDSGTPNSGTPDAGNPQAEPEPAQPDPAAPPAQEAPAPSE